MKKSERIADLEQQVRTLKGYLAEAERHIADLQTRLLHAEPKDPPDRSWIELESPFPKTRWPWKR